LQPLTDESGRLRAAWRLLAQYLSYRVAVVVFVNLVVGAWLLVRFGSGALSAGGPAISALLGSPSVFLISNLASLAAVFLTAWLAGRLFDRRLFRDFGFRLSGWWFLDLLFGIALGVLLMTAIFLAQLTLGWVEVTGTFETANGSAKMPFALAVLVPLAAFVCVGMAEETMYRGYELRNAAEGLAGIFEPRGAVLAAWACTSLFFGTLHSFNPNAGVLSTINIALAGVLLGIGYVLTGELAIPIGLHITWNFFQGNVFGFPVSGLGPVGVTVISIEQGGPTLLTGGAFGPEAGLLVTAAILAGSLLTALWVRIRRGSVAIHAPLAQGPEKTAESRSV